MASSPTAGAASCPDGEAELEGGGCGAIAPGSAPSEHGARPRPVSRGRVTIDQREVVVEGFWLDERVATGDDYRACREAGICSQRVDAGEECRSEDTAAPVSCLSFYEAEKLCAWAGKRLPTLEEWHRAKQAAERFGIEALGTSGSEWTSSFSCRRDIGGCGQARIRAPNSYAMPWTHPGGVKVRCAWSVRVPPPPADAPPPLLSQPSTTPGKIYCGTTVCVLPATA